MFHLVAHALDQTLLFNTHAEARHLFDLAAAAFPDATAFCVMPDHVHIVVPHAPEARRLQDVMSGFARWRNARRGETGAVWRTAPPMEELADATHARRTARYVHLNPCRAKLVGDPLAWPWSTHRDATGFAAFPVRERAHEPARYHTWVTSDPSVALEGTALPAGARGTVSWEQVREAVAGVCRVPADALARRGPARTLAIRAAWFMEVADVARLTEELEIAPSGIYRLAAELPPRAFLSRDPALHACIRAVGDTRFYALPTGDLRRTPAFVEYRRRRLPRSSHPE